MKKFLKITGAIFISIIILCGCQSNEAGIEKKIESNSDIITAENTTFKETTESAVNVQTETPDSPFTGLKKSQNTPRIGNSVSCLNQNGLIYKDDNKTIYCNDSGDLIINQNEKQETLLNEVYAKCINVIDDSLYYINSSDQNRAYIYSLTESTNEVYINDPVVFLMVSDDFTVFENENRDLSIKSAAGTSVISENNVLWVDIYGENIIYTELYEKKANVKAYNLNTQDITMCLNYGFSPHIHNDSLYYQAENGNIYSLDFTNGSTDEVKSEWGQQFCFIGDNMFYLSSKGIHSNDGIIYSSENTDNVIDSLFECGGSIYFVENDTSASYLYEFDTDTGERVMIK